ncbi:dipeptide ABC transporter ATP-binding protein [Candidatus Protofrankia datiscae]|uniref:dipeptide ABC transporter ATP-binding protein n=1 Tax=Candidatus Protofrankia datiscae TaxID=2716812 RepID=UPI001872251F|nr:ABC transporter ATP-binding protein [Candidatus Protofrankia datiscae]
MGRVDSALAESLLVVDGLDVTFTTGGAAVHAVRDVSFTLDAGRCLALVGESGSGKSVTARTLVGLTGENAVLGARRLRFAGEDLAAFTEARWRAVRGRRIGLVLQDALVSLDPLRTVGAEIAEVLRTHRVVPRAEIDARMLKLLDDVGVPEPARRARQYPHELSGGLRQRALIASAIAAGPALVLADEPTTALDVTVQAQVLDLLRQHKIDGAALLLISHDLAVVGGLADDIAVMYAGHIVEHGPAEQILGDPRHPYTRALLDAVPVTHTKGTRLAPAASRGPLPGPAGCPYADRCPRADDRCRERLPARAVPAGAHHRHDVLCWHPFEALSVEVLSVEVLAAEVLAAEVLAAEVPPARALSAGAPSFGAPSPGPATDTTATAEDWANTSGTEGAAATSGTAGAAGVVPTAALGAAVASPRPAAPGDATGVGIPPRPRVGAAATGEALLEVEGVSRRFRSPDGTWRDAVRDVSLRLHAGETLGVVGESGSGKTTVARIVLGQLEPDTGTVHFAGQPWSGLRERARRARRRRIQAIYQDPLGSFDPRYRVERIIGEAVAIGGVPGDADPARASAPRGAARRARVVELLDQVGLPADVLRRRPLELSGGQRQRVAIARALAPGPDLIVCDEPVSALDVSIQAQILDLLAGLQHDLGVALLFISHDLGVIHHASDRIIVMKDGQVVETGDVTTVFARPAHAYTRQLLAAVPRPVGGRAAPPGPADAGPAPGAAPAAGSLSVVSR